MQNRYSQTLLLCIVVVIATSCGNEVDTDSGPLRPVPPSNAEEQATANLTIAIQRDLDILRMRPMSREQRARIDAAEVRVRRALRNLRATHRRGAYRGVAMAQIGGISAALVADDATGVGVADDGLLILCGIAAVITIITTNAAASPQQLKHSWDQLHHSLVELDGAITAVTAETCTTPIEPIHPANESQERAESNASGATHTHSESLADTARRRGSNQKCSNDELTRLQNLADSICKGGGQNTCSSARRSRKRLARLKCSEVLRRQATHEACVAARRDVQNRCFWTTDSGHVDAIRNRERAVVLCRKLALQQCAPDSPYNDR